MAKFIVEDLTDGLVTLKVPGMNYRNTFVLKNEAGIGLSAGEKVNGTIHAPAWKAEHVDMGGNYVEPLYGRPRRMQGTILSVNSAANELTVQVGYPVTVKLPEKYSASNFVVGGRVGWDNIEIPTFELQTATAVTMDTVAPSLGM